MREQADVLLLAGDLTQHGRPEEAEVVAGELEGLGVPIVAVLGNHDLDADRGPEVVAKLEQAGVHVLEGSSVVLRVNGLSLGVAGTKGFGGGVRGACATDFGEPEMKAFIRHTREVAERLAECLARLHTDVKIALTHYAPIPDTLVGERREIYPFLGSYLLGDAIDRGGCDLAIHGHAHRGRFAGTTPKGIPVHNVAQPLIATPYHVFSPAGRSP